MKEKNIGEMIQKIRKEKQITQEHLAEGICSVSTLSKIENGSQVPKQQMMKQLLERLGEPDCDCSGYASLRELQLSQLFREVMEAMEFQEMERLEEKMWAIHHLANQKDHKEVQILELIQCLWMRYLMTEMQGTQDAMIQQRFLQAYRLTHPEFDGKRTGENTRINRVEMLLLNNIGISYHEQHLDKEALTIFLQMYQLQEKNTKYGREYWKPKAGICANLAICFLQLKMYEEAMFYCNKGLYCAGRTGNVMICLNLLRSRAMTCAMKKDMEGYYENLLLARKCYEMRPTQFYRDVAFETYMKSLKVLLVF